MRRFPPLVLWLGLLLPTVGTSPAPAALDLSQTVVERLDNGLTVLVLAERSVPVVSVQMLYRVGARNEVVGRTGLAHFLEHMAFRATESFPDTDVVSRIYAAGGEWHGYTWIDQTTYYETLPAEELDLALSIEADRLARLLLPGEEFEAERGAVLAELHGYENDPETVLVDAVLATSFLQHPYRYNTIGWESDVERLTHEDVVAFYREHYRAPNGVLAIVGDVDPADVLERVRDRFGSLTGGEPSPLPRTVEPRQRGIRRVDVEREGANEKFLIAWRAPSAADPDWPAFLLLREILGGTGGVSFLQEGFGLPVREGTRLADTAGSVSAGSLSTWSLASALPYVFGVLGTAAEGQSRRELEEAIEREIAEMRSRGPSEPELERARQRLLEELVFDLQTTEDAAHQLAYFEGIDALDVLLDLPARLRSVTRMDVRRVAREWLRPEGRTIGWVGPTVTSPVVSPRKEPPLGEGPVKPTSEVASGSPSPSDLPSNGDRTPTTDDRESETADTERGTGEPVVFRLSSGLPIAFQRSPLSPTGYLRILIPASPVEAEGDLTIHEPVWRHASLGVRFPAENLEEAVAEAYARWRNATISDLDADPPASPGPRLTHELRRSLGIEGPTVGSRAPALIAVAGDLDEARVRKALEPVFGSISPGSLPPAPSPKAREAAPLNALPGLVQARLGYAVPAPPPDSDDWAAWRMLLYVLTHDYEGRLGKEAISRRGLLNWIGSEYHCDGRDAWIAIEMGVDPPKLEAIRTLFDEILEGLESSPPSDEEIEEARSHLLGRHVTAAQSNPEITARLAEETICSGNPHSYDELARRLDATTRKDVVRAVDAFLDGVVIVVR